MSDTPSHVVNVDEVAWIEHHVGEHWGGSYKPLSPSMAPKGGTLGVSLSRLPKGRTTCPFHYHLREDEAFFVLSGRGVLRYGDDVRLVRPGDCISCPAGTRVAHQIANPFDEDLVYLAMGPNDPHEVAVYPNTGKVMVRSLGRVGWLENVDYMAGEADVPAIFALARTLVDGAGPADR